MSIAASGQACLQLSTTAVDKLNIAHRCDVAAVRQGSDNDLTGKTGTAAKTVLLNWRCPAVGGLLIVEADLQRAIRINGIVLCTKHPVVCVSKPGQNRMARKKAAVGKLRPSGLALLSD